MDVHAVLMVPLFTGKALYKWAMFLVVFVPRQTADTVDIHFLTIDDPVSS